MPIPYSPDTNCLVRLCSLRHSIQDMRAIELYCFAIKAARILATAPVVSRLVASW